MSLEPVLINLGHVFNTTCHRPRTALQGRPSSGLGDRLGNGPNRRKRDTVKQNVHTVPVDGVHAGVRRGAGSGESFF